MNMDANILNQILENQIQQQLKIINHHDPGRVMPGK
jgi:hypothetical protein